MSKVVVTLAVLMFGGGLGGVSGDPSKEDQLVGPQTIDEASTVMAGSFVDECLWCHICPGLPEGMYTDTVGASTLTRPYPIFECEPPFTCIGCEPDQEEDEDTELALSELIESGGDNLLGWVDEYHGEFALTVIGSTLQISRECGQAITWLALGELEPMTVTDLLEQ